MSPCVFVPTVLLALAVLAPVDDPDLRSVEADLEVPTMVVSEPAAGERVRSTSDSYAGTEVHHVLYLPTDWEPGGTYPVIVEFAGNGGYANELGDSCTGRPEGASLGYGIGGGEEYIWLCLPFVSADGQENELRWWGDVERTVAYAKRVVPEVCAAYGGDPDAVVLAGFSRGAIACNFIGLHDDEIAALWAGFVCHSHYDGVRSWAYEGSDRVAARERLARLGDRPQWISHEGSVAEVSTYLESTGVDGEFTLRALPFRNHTDEWVLRDLPLRTELRAWMRALVGETEAG